MRFLGPAEHFRGMLLAAARRYPAFLPQDPLGIDAATHAARRFIIVELLFHGGDEIPSRPRIPMVRFYVPVVTGGPQAVMSACEARVTRPPAPVEGGFTRGGGGCALAAFSGGETPSQFLAETDRWFKAPSFGITFMAVVVDQGAWTVLPGGD